MPRPWSIVIAGLGLGACQPSVPPAPPASRCLQLPASSAPAVAQVGTVPITAEHVALVMKEQSTALRRRYRDVAELRELVEDQVRMELLAQAALERGLDRDPEVVAAARKIMVRKLLERDLTPATFNVEAAQVSEQQIVNYYERHRHKYVQPELRRIAHIQLAPNEKGQVLATSLISQLGEQKVERGLFRQLALRYSQAPDKERAGELLFKTHQELTAEFGPSFANEVFAMGASELSPAPVQSTRGWHVVRVIAARDALTRPLEEVREEIRDKLLRGERSQAFDGYLAELRARYPVAVFEDRLRALATTLAEAQREQAP